MIYITREGVWSVVGRHCFLSWQVGGKTPFILVKRARVLRVTRRQAAMGGRGGERLGLVHVSGKKKKKREARRLGAALPTVGEGPGALDNDDISVISCGGSSIAVE